MLHDDQSLEQCGVRANLTIHVYQKRAQLEYESEAATDEQIQKAVKHYRSAFLAGTSLAVNIVESKTPGILWFLFYFVRSPESHT